MTLFDLNVFQLKLRVKEGKFKDKKFCVSYVFCVESFWFASNKVRFVCVCVCVCVCVETKGT